MIITRQERYVDNKTRQKLELILEQIQISDAEIQKMLDNSNNNIESLYNILKEQEFVINKIKESGKE